VALYDATNGQLIYRFPAGARVEGIDLTSDEKYLLIACTDGRLNVWDIETGENVWQRTPRQTRLGYASTPCFALDGKSFVVRGDRDFAVIANTATGEQVGVVRFPPGQTSILSACLSPDGSSGVLIERGQNVFSFETTSGGMRGTGAKGAWPVRCSVDGKYAAFRNSDDGTGESLRVLTLDAPRSWRDVAELGHIGQIRATSDDGFLATGVGPKEGHYYAVGVRYYPVRGVVEEVWRLKGGDGMERMDFDPTTMRGVYTDFRLVTRFMDLRTGVESLRIDNSDNYEPLILSTSNVYSWPTAALGAGVVIGVALVAVRFWWRRRACRGRRSPRTHRHPGGGGGAGVPGPGASEARLTGEARASLDRLARRPTPTSKP
jgi:hypothetical protein